MGNVRGIRGATTAQENTREAILKVTGELLQALVRANDVESEDVAAVFFTTTPDLNAEFPAQAARKMGWTDLALLCGHEMSVPDALPGCIRILMLVNTEKSQKDLKHLYLNDAKDLRNRGMGGSLDL